MLKDKIAEERKQLIILLTAMLKQVKRLENDLNDCNHVVDITLRVKVDKYLKGLE